MRYTLSNEETGCCILFEDDLSLCFGQMELVNSQILSIMEPFLDKRFVSYKGICGHILFNSTHAVHLCNDIGQSKSTQVSADKAIFIFIASHTLDPEMSDVELEAWMR